MSATQIINELPKLTAAELESVRQKLAEILAEIAAENSSVNLAERGLAEPQAADLRSRLKTFAADWERPEASIYDETPAR